MRTQRQRRADVLATFARRAIFAVRAQRQRTQESEVITFDIDFYVFAAWQLREAGRQALARLGLESVRPALAESSTPRSLA